MAVGIAGLVFLARQFAVRAVRHARDLYEIRAFCFHSWIVGTVIAVALEATYLALTPGTSPDAVFAIMLGAASLGVFAPMAMMFWQKVTTGEGAARARGPPRRHHHRSHPRARQPARPRPWGPPRLMTRDG